MSSPVGITESNLVPIAPIADCMYLLPAPHGRMGVRVDVVVLPPVRWDHVLIWWMLPCRMGGLVELKSCSLLDSRMAFLQWKIVRVWFCVWMLLIWRVSLVSWSGHCFFNSSLENIEWTNIIWSNIVNKELNKEYVTLVYIYFTYEDALLKMVMAAETGKTLTVSRYVHTLWHSLCWVSCGRGVVFRLKHPYEYLRPSWDTLALIISETWNVKCYQFCLAYTYKSHSRVITL